jgi:hypothetical protein
MFKRAGNWWVPVGSFAVAVALSVLSGPGPALARRAQQETTGGTCCHVASFSRTGVATVDVKDSGIISSYSVHIEFHSNGNLLVQGSVSNSRLEVPRLQGKVDCELNKNPNAVAELCMHNADIKDDIEAHWKFSLPAIAKLDLLIKSQVSLKLKPEIESVENFDGAVTKEKSDLEGKVDVTPALGLEETKIELGKEGPKIETKVEISLALPKSDQDGKPKTIINRQPFKQFALLSVRHNITVFDMTFLIGVGSLSCEASTRVSPPTLVDTDEAAWVKFTGPDSLKFKRDCNTPEVDVPPPTVDPKFVEKLKKSIVKHSGIK